MELDGAEAILLLFIQILWRSELMMESRQGEGDHFKSWDKSQIATSSRLTAIQTNGKVTRVLETLSRTLICRLKEKRTTNACRRGTGYIFVISTLPLSSCGHWNSHLWAFLCVNPPHAARMPAAPRLTPCPQHFDGSQSLIHRVLQPGSDSSSLCTICLLLPSLHPSSGPRFFFFIQLLSAFFLSATLFPHLVWLHAGHHRGQCVCMCVGQAAAKGVSSESWQDVTALDISHWHWQLTDGYHSHTVRNKRERETERETDRSPEVDSLALLSVHRANVWLSAAENNKPSLANTVPELLSYSLYLISIRPSLFNIAIEWDIHTSTEYNKHCITHQSKIKWGNIWWQ